MLKRTWIALILVLIFGYILLKDEINIGSLRHASSPQLQSVAMDGSMAKMADFTAESRIGIMPPVAGVPPVQTDDRLVIRDTSLSLLVKDVANTIGEIEAKAKAYGGFLIDSSLSKPEGAATGAISVRVPTEKRDEALQQIREMGVKVVSEQVMGEDVTAQHVDLVARLETASQTKAKFEELLKQATQIQDILSIQRELDSLQAQIDNLKGQQEFLAKSASLSKISVYLSTDELALPYAPDAGWRPAVVFKKAVRSLVVSVRDFGNLVIWIAVYTPIWLPVLSLIWWLNRKRKA